MCSVIQGPDGYKVYAFNIPVDVHVSIFTVERAVMDHGYIMSDLRYCKCHARLGWTCLIENVIWQEPSKPSVTKRGRFTVSSYHAILVDSISSDMDSSHIGLLNILKHGMQYTLSCDMCKMKSSFHKQSGGKRVNQGGDKHDMVVDIYE
ncbi:hypothetical protein QJS10_CPA03g01509 [Acorus calamus]|uniref:Yippee domain-containing protein n=1 Tax=Acorus calamus TaxID=4465 RepID=A0AAV9F4L3_ACOCL|nr:hypothetical protein QJS10_CPA03g01509 [Acorus calamus]